MYCGKYAKTPQGGGGFFPLCCHEYALGAAETGISKAAEGYGMESCALATEKAEDTLTVQEKEEQSREQTGIIAPRSIAVYEGVVMAASQDKEKKVSARSLKRKQMLPEKDDRTK